MRTSLHSPVAVTGMLVLLLLATLPPAPAAPAVAPNMQMPPTPTPTPIPGMGPLLPPGFTSGEPHLRTPDGRDYDFQAAGEFVLVASTVDDLAIQVRQEPLGASTVVSINTAVAMSVAGDRVGVYVGEQPPLRVNGEPTTLDDGSRPLPRGGRVERQGTRYAIVWPDQSVVEVTLRSQYLDVVVRLAPTRAGQVVGLFGTADGNAANDLATRDGSVVEVTGLAAETVRARLYGEFGASWQISQAESLFDYGPGEGTSTYARPDFPSALIAAGDLHPRARRMAETLCRRAGVAEAGFLADCVLDVGLTGNREFAASAAEVEAAFAADAGGVVAGGALYQTDTFLGQGSETWRVVTFHAEIRVDSTTSQITGGALSQEAINETAGWSQTSEGTLNVPEGGLALGDNPVQVGFWGTSTTHYFADPGGIWGGNLPPDTTMEGGIAFFDATFDDAGNLVLCRPRNFGLTASGQQPTPVPDEDWQEWCLANVQAVLEPVAEPPA